MADVVQGLLCLLGVLGGDVGRDQVHRGVPEGGRHPREGVVEVLYAAYGLGGFYSSPAAAGPHLGRLNFPPISEPHRSRELGLGKHKDLDGWVGL